MNLRLAVRTLFRAPVVTSVAVFSLALGIGANTAIFSLFDQLILRPLPVASPQELVNLQAPGPKPGGTSCNQAGSCEAVFSYQMFRDLERDHQGLSGVAGHFAFGANLAYGGDTANTNGVYVSGGYFPALGLQPAIGRLLGPDDDRVVGGHFVAVLSHDYWRSRFGTRPDVLGELLVVNGQPMTIVGVAPQGFTGTTLGNQPALFVPISMRGLLSPGFTAFENRRSYWVYVFGRLDSGVSIDQASAALNVTYRQILQDVEAPLQEGMSDQTMARFLAREIVVEPGARGQSSLHAEARAPLLMLLTVTGIVLLITCANVANLLLSRAAGRTQEMAIRLSLGASRRQLVAQVLAEASLIGLLGGLVGLAVARATLGLIVSLLPPDGVRMVAVGLDGPLLAAAAVLSLGTALVVGMYPAWHGTGASLVSGLRSAAGQPGGARSASRFRTVLATAQIALSMALLVAAGLFTRSLVNVSRVDLGVNTDRLATFRLSPELNGYPADRSHALFMRLEEDLAAMPGVIGVSASRVPLIAGNSSGANVSVQGFDAGPDTDTFTNWNEVGPGYFRTVGMPVLAGREFGESDTIGQPRVAVVNEAFTRKFGLGRDAAGMRMAVGRQTDLDIEIVGVVADAKYSDVKQEVPPQYFLPYRQNERLGNLSFYVRGALDETAILRAIPGVVRQLDQNLPVVDLKTMATQVRERVVIDRVISILAAAFATLATLLAALGLYGVLAYMVAQRTREIGLRMALGASERAIRRLVLRRVGAMTLVGVAIGLAAAVSIGRLARSLLYEVDGYDPATLVVSVVLLTAIAFAAGFMPARRASRVDPMAALRQD